MNTAFRAMAFVVLGIALSASACRAETVRIIAEDDWYPYSAKFDNGPQGLAVDIVRAAFKAEGVDVAFDVMNYDRGMEMVKAGQAVGCFDASRTKENEDVYLWHDKPLFPAECYYYADSAFEGSVQGPQDLIGKKVGLTQGYEYGDTIDLNTKMVKEYSNEDKTLIRKLLAKRLDMIVLFNKVGDYLIPLENASGKIRQIGKACSTDIYVAFSKSNADGQKYRDVLSRGLAKIEADGTYQNIMAAWQTKLGAGSK